MIEIVSLTNKEKTKFIKFAWKIYKDDPHWVPPLLMDMKKKFEPGFSFFEYGELQLFMAKKDGEFVGRIAAIKNDLYNKTHNSNTGFFGFFECINDQEVANKLFDTAKEWLLNKGLDIMHGPASPSSNHDYGLLVEGFDDSPRLMMTYNPRYYIDLVKNYGFKKTIGLLAYKLNKEDVNKNEKLQRIAKMAKERAKMTIRPINMKDIKNEVQHIKNIWNEAWELNDGFMPMTDKEIDELAADIKPIAEPSLILFGEIDGQVMGVGVAVLDYNHIFKQMDGKLFPFNFIKVFTKKKEIKWMRVIVLGILPKYQRKGLDAAFYHQLIQNGFDLNLEYAEASWILENNEMMNRGMKVVNGEIYKRYHAYEIPISS